MIGNQYVNHGYSNDLQGSVMLIYATVCIMGEFNVQTKVTFLLTIVLGLGMLLVVIGGAVYVVHDISNGR